MVTVRDGFVLPPEHLIIGARGPEVRISGRVAALLNRHARLDEFRRTIRGRDPELDAALVALRHAGEEWITRSTGSGTERAEPAEPAPRSETMNTTAAATQLRITERAVRKAITDGRLTATKIDGRYRITREDVAHYREGTRA